MFDTQFMHLVLRLLLTAFLSAGSLVWSAAPETVRQALGPMCWWQRGQPFDDCFHLWH